jgi:hypothetical protein
MEKFGTTEPSTKGRLRIEAGERKLNTEDTEITGEKESEGARNEG